MPLSVVSRFFEGEPFKNHLEAKKAESKVHIAVIDRLNTVIRATGIVAKTIAKRGS